MCRYRDRRFVPLLRPRIWTGLSCQFVSESLEQAIELGKATLVVSGGSTPLGFLRLLAQRQLPWSQVLVTLADERWVPVQHADSNERMVREQLIDHTGAQFLSLRGVESSSAEGAAAVTGTNAGQ